MPKLLLPLVALLAIGGSAAGASVYLLTRDETVVEVQPSPVVEASPTEAATLAPAESPTPTPAAWLTYVDPVRGFSLDYPSDLVAKDVTGPSPDGLNERAIEFRSAEDNSRAFVISVSENVKGLTLEQWAVEYGACQPKSIQQSTLGGIPALACTREVVEGRPGPAVLADHGGKIFLLSGHLTESEFDQLRESFAF
jgi:hypothetical protein